MTKNWESINIPTNLYLLTLEHLIQHLFSSYCKIEYVRNDEELMKCESYGLLGTQSWFSSIWVPIRAIDWLIDWLYPTRFQPRFIHSYARLTSLADSRRNIDIISVLPHFILIYKIQEPSVPRGLPFTFDHHLFLLFRLPDGSHAMWMLYSLSHEGLLPRVLHLWYL